MNEATRVTDLTDEDIASLEKTKKDLRTIEAEWNKLIGLGAGRGCVATGLGRPHVHETVGKHAFAKLRHERWHLGIEQVGEPAENLDGWKTYTFVRVRRVDPVLRLIQWQNRGNQPWPQGFGACDLPPYRKGLYEFFGDLGVSYHEIRTYTRKTKTWSTPEEIHRGLGISGQGLFVIDPNTKWGSASRDFEDRRYSQSAWNVGLALKIRYLARIPGFLARSRSWLLKECSNLSTEARVALEALNLPIVEEPVEQDEILETGGKEVGGERVDD